MKTPSSDEPSQSRSAGTPSHAEPGSESPALGERVAELERRLAALETAAAQEQHEPSSAVTADGRSGSAASARAEEGTSASPAARFSANGPDDDTFWALNGLVDRLGQQGGVVYTGHITPPGTDGPVSWQMGLPGQAFDDIDFAEAAPALTAFSHPVRLALLQAIYEGTTTVAELSADDRFGTTGQIYHHLKALAASGWLENIPRGHWRVPGQKIIPLLALILIGTT